MTTEFARLPKNKANCHKVYQMFIKDVKNFHPNASQNVPKLGIWFENKPSGNNVCWRHFNLNGQTFTLLLPILGIAF
jgi:hypothetical protein